MNKLPIIVVLTNDAGATEYLAHLVIQEYHQANWRLFCLKESPASKIFQNLNLDYTLLDNMQDFNNISKCDLIIYGTGWQVEFGKIVEKISSKYEIKSMALIDHWVNYKERFSCGFLPDYIITMDDIAFNLAHDIFSSDVKIIQLKNYFLEDIVSSFKLLKNKNSDFVVFISEPTSIVAKNNLGDSFAYGFTEYSVFSDLLKKFDEIIVRLHPADSLNKYSNLIEKYPNKNIVVVNPYQESLIETLSKSKLTIGFDGMALFISYFLRINTISYMPNSSRKLTIPIPKKYLIDNLLDLDTISFDNDVDIDLNKNSISFSSIIKKILKD